MMTCVTFFKKFSPLDISVLVNTPVVQNVRTVDGEHLRKGTFWFSSQQIFTMAL
jgi:hypothetical protein